MKKRSLFAAVAMLLVSALLLTSSTYAWFAKKTSTEVESVTSSVSNTDGSLQVSITGTGGWQDKLTTSDITGAVGNYTGSNTLKPVDGYLTGSTMGFYGCDFTGSTFKKATPATNDYIHYTWYIKSNKSANIYLHPSFAGAAPIYGAIKVSGVNSGNPVIITNSSTGYSYFSADLPTTAFNDSSTNPGIVDQAELTAAGSSVTVSSQTITSSYSSLYIPAASVNADQAIAVEVWVWAEGQDAACVGTISTAITGGFSFAPSYDA